MYTRHKRNARLVSTTLRQETDTKNAHYDTVRSFACEVARARDVRDVMVRVWTGGREAARAKHKAPQPGPATSTQSRQSTAQSSSLRAQTVIRTPQTRKL